MEKELTFDLDRVSVEVVTAVLQRHFPEGAPKKVQLFLTELSVDVEARFKVVSEYGAYDFMIVVDKTRGEKYITLKLLAMIRYGLDNLRTGADHEFEEE